jgi:hypothetical protein
VYVETDHDKGDHDRCMIPYCRSRRGAHFYLEANHHSIFNVLHFTHDSMDCSGD